MIEMVITNKVSCGQKLAQAQPSLTWRSGASFWAGNSRGTRFSSSNQALEI